MGGAVAGAAVARARRRVIERFMKANAVSPDKAIKVDTGRFVERRMFERLVDAGVIKPTEHGHYLDLPAYQANLKQRRRIAGMVIGGLAVVGGAAAALLSL